MICLAKKAEKCTFANKRLQKYVRYVMINKSTIEEESV